jgi:D-alanyl-D-alanine carboxypeptidase
MRRQRILLATISLFAATIAFDGVALARDRHAAVVIDAASGEVLYEDEADARRFPASLAKMMTLYLLFDAIEHGETCLEDILTVSANAAEQPRSNLGLREGDFISVEDAIRALTVRSANDVATVIAERLAGSETRFAAQMTERARIMGLTDTRFANASGLPDATQRTTARDMARLGRALWADFPDYYHYFQTAEFTWDNERVRNHNHLLTDVDGVDGIKTGFTNASGFNIASSAQRDGRRIVVVVMGGDTAAERDEEATNLINDAFAEYDRPPVPNRRGLVRTSSPQNAR